MAVAGSSFAALSGSKFCNRQDPSRYETHLPAKRREAQENPRFSSPHEDEGWTQGPECPPSQRQGARDGLGFLLTSLQSKQARLRQNSLIRGVIRSGRNSREKWFSFHVLDNTLSHARLAVVVSRRVSVRAVDRNRIKRLIRESFRHFREKLPGIDVVVVARHPCRLAKNAELLLALQDHWSKLESN